jgi:PKD repeat protein
MKVKSLDATGTGTAVLPENAEYQIVFSITGTDNNPHTVYVELDTFAPNSQALPGVSIGRRDPCTAGCGTLDSSISANIVTATYSADGTIQLKLDASGPIVFAAPTAPGTGTAFTWDARNAGVSMASIVGNTQLFVGAGAGFLETVSVTSGGSYTRVGNNSCSSGLPTARLTASTQAGGAPLSVNFDGATSSDPAPCVAVTSYTLNFGDGSAPVTQASPMFNHTYTTAGDYPARLTVKDANGNTSTNPAQVIITVTGGTVPLSGVVSRKTHTGLGDFDIVMPGIECRNGGSQGSHTLIAAFDNTLTSVSSATATATTSSGTQSVTVLGTSGIGTNNHQFIVNLSGVPNASHVAVTLHGVTDSASNTGDVVLNGDFLLGDTTANGAVNASDIAQTQSESGHSVSSSNFREDVTVNGALNSSDIATVQAQSGTALPAAPAQTTTPPSTAPGTAPASAPPSKRQPKHKARPRSAGSF